MTSYERFIELFCQIFDHSPKGMEVSEQLLTLKQGSRCVVEYLLEFCTLTAGSRWNEPALKVTFCQGLNPQVLTELACQDEQATLNSLIDMFIQLDNLLQN